MTIAGIHEDRVTRWFDAHVPEATPPFRFRLLAGGHSNLTFRVNDTAGRSFVLRRPPLGSVLESAHDMAREHRIVSALGPTDVPVAPTFGLCEDRDVNDAPFYVMGFVEGRVLHDAESTRAVPLDDRRTLGFDVIDVLARLHSVDPDDVGLGDLGKKEAYVARQLRRWSKQWNASKTRELEAMDEAHRILEERMPEQRGATIVHGDFRIGNFIVADARIAAVLDWELCTLGDPLADVGYLMNDWITPYETVTISGTPAPTAAGGFPSREEILARYEAETGRDVSNVAYYRAFQYWRSAAIIEGVYARYIHGAMGDARGVDVEAIGRATEALADQALAALS